MASRAEILEKVKSYASKCAEKPYDLPTASTDSDYENRLDETINELRSRVEQETAPLQELRARVGSTSADFDQPSEDPKVRLHQLSAITTAYSRLAVAQPFLPSPTSALPVALAFRDVESIIASTKASIPATHAALEAARKRLQQEEADDADNAVLAAALEARISKLQISAAEQAQESPEERVRATVAAEVSRRESYEAETKKITRALVHFINTKLAPLLAAEELGGPVAGSLQDITEEMLVLGFNAQGKPKKNTKAAVAEDTRQLRIDQIWGVPAAEEDSFEEQPRSEAEAAAKEMRDLVEALLELITDQASGQYVKLRRESAASRFLVRANVAMLHRNDALRIRLIDFGREVEN